MPDDACEPGIRERIVDREIGWTAHVAQSAERILGKDEVTSSILVVGSMHCSSSATGMAGVTPP